MTNETIEHIVEVMRSIFPPAPYCNPTVTGQFVHDEMWWFADRIEAAYKRECEIKAELLDVIKGMLKLGDKAKNLIDKIEQPQRIK